MKIVIIGGTGLIGSKTVDRLRKQGHEVVAASPNTGVNTITGEGLAAALIDLAAQTMRQQPPAQGATPADPRKRNSLTSHRWMMLNLRNGRKNKIANY